MHSVTTSKGPAVGVPIFEQIGTITIDVLPVELYATQRFDNLDAMYFLNTAQRNYIKKHKTDFNTFSIPKKLIFFENSIQKDIKLRNALKGMIIGLFQTSEYESYIQNSSALNKRMMHLLIERYKSQVQLFE
jgi:hypothetical protein